MSNRARNAWAGMRGGEGLDFEVFPWPGPSTGYGLRVAQGDRQSRQTRDLSLAVYGPESFEPGSRATDAITLTFVIDRVFPLARTAAGWIGCEGKSAAQVQQV